MPPRSIVVNPTAPSNTLSFALPPGVTIDVESVLAAVDASGAGDTTALLAIADSSGAVIARKRQTEVITAGTNPGSATWALRLADEQAGAAGTKALETFNDPAGIQIIAGGVDFLPWVHSSGAALLDLTVPAAPTVIASGTYSFACVVLQTQFIALLTAGRVSGGFFLPGLGVLPAGLGGQIVGQTLGPFAMNTSITLVADFPAGTTVRALGTSAQPVTTTFQLGAYVERLA